MYMQQVIILVMLGGRVRGERDTRTYEEKHRCTCALEKRHKGTETSSLPLSWGCDQSVDQLATTSLA